MQTWRLFGLIAYGTRRMPWCRPQNPALQMLTRTMTLRRWLPCRSQPLSTACCQPHWNQVSVHWWLGTCALGTCTKFILGLQYSLSHHWLLMTNILHTGEDGALVKDMLNGYKVLDH